ncbi:hypothetical protein [Clostridium estertheticum]|uniref:hypothetical protein n=1 Tax=Clostridium estertheticum TaxID=238834 RepID=UPI001C0CD89D|nr:hypothetical protein [Clostridium estertheticum]MBU3074766.1 hypothetical protein [Clostridium estertheticum]MBU3164981.1 hypothetical protein [Clostridium estertheticum]
MPQIFDDVTRKQIRINMLDNGYELIKKNGYKKTPLKKLQNPVLLPKAPFTIFYRIFSK